MPRLLQTENEKTIEDFPHLFDLRQSVGFDRLAANAPANFLLQRSFDHLNTLLIVQFILQRKMERTLEGHRDQKPLFLKLFQKAARICCALNFHTSYNLSREQLFTSLKSLLPGIQCVPHSVYSWLHSDHPYQFFYFEVEKMRGEGITIKDLRKIEKAFKGILQSLPPLTPALFWPYNAEESFRQVQLLQREIQHPNELPHISILFQEQTLFSLEFLVHYARPKNTNSLEESLKELPPSIDFIWHFNKLASAPLHIELGAFSLQVPSSVFDENGSINLLYARRYITKCLEKIFGSFRDYNGGLFEKQQAYFATIRDAFSEKIPLFDLFAEKVFYALHPIEARINLTLSDAENLLLAFSEILQLQEKHTVFKRLKNVTIVKNGNGTDQLSANFRENCDENILYAHLNLGTDSYYCSLGSTAVSPPQINQSTLKERERLRLCFQEGAPPSLNPHLSSGDMRCRLLSKLLFEGLMRLNTLGEPECAGALEYHILEEGMRYQFILRPCFWSNGEKVTAVDYVTSWQHALRDYVSHPEHFFVIKNARLFKEFKCDGSKLGILAKDAQTLEIELEYPDLRFLDKLTQPFFFPLFGSMREPKWVNGPYFIRNHTSERLLLERNPYFWRRDTAYFEQIEIKWVKRTEDIYNLFKNGEIDWIGDPICTLSPHTQTQHPLQTREVDRRFVIHFNTKLPHLASANIRHALSLAIDRVHICDTLFPHNIPLPHPDPFNNSVQALFEAGLKELQLTHSTFPPITFTFSHQTGREELGLILQSFWQQQLGITVHLEKVEWNTFRNKLEKGAFEIVATIQETLEKSPLEFLERFEGSSSWNFSQWRHSGYRRQLNSALETKDPKKRLLFLEKAEKILIEEAPFTPLFRCTHLFTHQPKLQNYFFDADGCIDFSQAYFNEDST